MTSLITEDGPVEPIFQEYAEAVASALRQLGAPAVVAGRNDIVLEGGGKVCGNAFYHKANCNIAHGTMLYDTDPRLMEGALHPDVSKLEAKGVKSVRSRVGFLKDYLPFDVQTLRQRLRHLLTNRTITLTDEDVREIERMEQQYYKEEFSGEWRMEKTIHQKLSRRIEGCGTVELHFQLEDNLIRSIELRGDFFDLGHATETFNAAFAGIPFTPEGLCEAIRKHHPERTIWGLSEADIIRILIGQ